MFFKMRDYSIQTYREVIKRNGRMVCVTSIVIFLVISILLVLKEKAFSVMIIVYSFIGFIGSTLFILLLLYLRLIIKKS